MRENQFHDDSVFCFPFIPYNSIYFEAEPRGYLTKVHTGERGSALRSNSYPLNTLSYTIF